MNCPVCCQEMLARFPSIEEGSSFLHRDCVKCNILYVWIKVAHLKSIIENGYSCNPNLTQDIRRQNIEKVFQDHRQEDSVEYFIFEEDNRVYSLKDMHKLCKLKVFW